ncbi:MAG: protein kinase domain-containing protein [Phycisphaerales bacterium]
MNHDRQRIAEGLFKEARGLPVPERNQFITDKCGSDAALQEEVRSLLSWNEDSSGVLDRPPPLLDGVTEADAAAALLPPGGTIGQYKILSVLGVGGMGVVYVAEQKRPQRTVALKVIRPGLASPSVLRRLEYEAEVLGKLQHPGIAQVIEAGTGDAGYGVQPFFAMELVKGQTLDVYCALKKLGTAERLKLVQLVCDAVEHAHRRGVIHRDLKPANILVDEAGQPKVLDFGVARAAGTREGEQQLTMLHSGERQLIGTLAYMSPEQVSGMPAEVDFRSDVYALGVILYELVAGKSPHDITSRSLPDAIRVIRDEEPRHLSSVNSSWRGDLDTIAAKALEKDKARRYQSAAELGADIERFLTDRPIAARPPSAVYQVGKFARRNKALVTGASIAVIALVAGLVVSTVQYARATRAAARSEQVASLLKGMIGGINPKIAQARDTTLLKDIVDKGVHDIGTKLKGQPQVEADLRKTLGEVYYSIGEFAPAEEQHRAAIAKFSASMGPETDEVAGAMIKLTSVLTSVGRHDEAVELAKKALAIEQKVFREGSEQVADATANLGAALVFTDSKEAIANLKSATQMYEKISGPNSIDVARTLEHLGQAQLEAGMGPEAEASFKRTHEIRRELLGPDDMDTTNVAGLLGDAYLSQQRYAEAEPFCREYAESVTKLLPPTHATVSLAWAALAQSLHRQGKLGEAIVIYKAQIAPMEKALGSDHLNVGVLHNNVGTVLVDAGDFAAAQKEFDEAMRIYRVQGGEENVRVPFALLGLANVKWGEKDYPASEQLARRSYEMGAKTLPAKHPQIGNAALRLAACLVELSFAAQGAEQIARADEAAKLADDSRANFAASMGEDHFNVHMAKARLACAHAAAACAKSDAAAFASAAKELETTRDTLTTRPTLGAFPARNLLLIDIERTLARLYTKWNAIAPSPEKNDLAAATQARQKTLETALIADRAAATASTK